VSIREGGLEVGPGDNRRRQELELRAGKLADNRLAGNLLPPGLRLPVEHDHVAVSQETRDAELEGSATHDAVEGDGRIAERAERDHHCPAADYIVDDLVPGEDLQGVSASVFCLLEGDNGLAVLEKGNL